MKNGIFKKFIITFAFLASAPVISQVIPPIHDPGQVQQCLIARGDVELALRNVNLYCTPDSMQNVDNPDYHFCQFYWSQYQNALYYAYLACYDVGTAF